MSKQPDIVETTFSALEVDRNVRRAHSRLDQLEQSIAAHDGRMSNVEGTCRWLITERDRLDRAIEGIACDLDNHTTSSEHCRFEPMQACFGCASLRERVAALEAWLDSQFPRSRAEARAKPAKEWHQPARNHGKTATIQPTHEPAKHEPEHKVMLSQVRDTHRELAALKEQLRWRKWPEEQPPGKPNGQQLYEGMQYGRRCILNVSDFWGADVTHWRPLGPGPEES